ncbi:hypothetical protein DENSPDRAFT_789577 [Dentipellis sp. KUC8613]|nr:hypothetical protein DENSPDRAFT_789577 [Dentipellis sp. KUC8613]
MFLVGVIPGPSEPSLDQINHLIAPLVDDLLLFYETGIRYTRTPRHPNGRDVRLALVPVVCDLPASRQLIGFASFSSLTFCVFCPLNLREIGNLDCDSWGQRTSEEYRRWAFRWRDAESESIRAKITTEHGVRYSELLRLPYWNPVENTVVDTLHALFLGNFQHHCRVVWGMDVKVEDGDGSTSDPLTSSLMTSLDVQKAFVALRKGSRKDVEALKMTTLRLLVQERGLRVTSRRKHVYVDTLINYRVREGIVDASYKLISPDPERFANARRANSERKKSRVLGHARLSEAWSDMERTTLPSWLAAAPAHIGEAKSGKVTADQWRTFCTIHLVVTLVRLWGTKDNNHSQREQDMLHNFMNLVAATKLASMRTMTAQRALAFKDFMLKYLHGLQDIFPGIPLTPNQHNTLHLFDIFRRFGPCHAWRCWAFERWNYLLQHIPTNRHFGELEKTMFERLCMGQRLRHIMNDAIDSVSNALRALADSFNRRFNADKRGTRLNDILAFVEPVQSPAEDLSLHKDTLTRVEVELLRRHLESQATSGLAPDAFRYATRVRHACQRHKKFHHRGASYSPWSSSPGDSYVVIGEDILGAWYAARIQGIFSHTQTPHSETRVVNTYFIIQRFKPLTIDEGSLDPYRAFPIAGGRLYHDTVESTLEFVTMKDILCHFAHTPFASKELGDCVHVLPIDRVCYYSKFKPPGVLISIQRSKDKIRRPMPRAR